MRQQWADYRVFWRQFRATFHTTGAVLPSGRALSSALTHYVCNGSASHDPRRILEVGPGTGAVTHRLVQAMRDGDRLDLVERNAEFVAHLRSRLSEEATFRAAAERITLRHAGVEELSDENKYDVIISGLPLNNFSVELVEGILAKFRRLLAAGGTLSFFEYIAIRRAKTLLSRQAERQRLREIGRVLDQLLKEREIHCTWVLANVPPAWVHHVQWS